jgi:23S rRNA G2445 N2-methylase RlmL
MRHRTYKVEHVAASLRPTVAAAMVRLGGVGPGMVLVDPMCGAGTILAEQLEVLNPHRAAGLLVCGGDRDRHALAAAGANLRRFSPALLARWDALHLPFSSASVDRIITNPPFGKQLGEPEEMAALYRAAIAEFDRALKPDGRVVMLVSDFKALRAATAAVGWKLQRDITVRVLGQRAIISVWRKPGA